MKTISLTKGKTALVDAIDHAYLIQFRWCYNSKGYCVHYWIDELGRKHTASMHRWIMERMLGHPIPCNLTVDHISRDRLDNRRSNLRLATRTQNQANKGVQVNNTTGFKGVNWHSGKWETRIVFQGRKLYLGRHISPVAAAMVYDCAARLLYHEFAGCNFDSPAPPHIQQFVLDKLVSNQIRLDLPQSA